MAEKYIELNINDGYLDMLQKHDAGEKFDVTFQTNRLPYQLQHHALEWFEMHGLYELLIKNSKYETSYEISYDENEHRESKYIDKESLNEEQNLAVKSITTGEYTIPYLLFGPPGEMNFM